MNNFSKQKVIENIAYVSLELPAEEVMKRLQKIMRKAKKTHTDIKMGTVYDDDEDSEGYMSSIPLPKISIMGKIEESERDWHKRLEREKLDSKRRIENAERTIKNKSKICKTIKAIDEALKESTLICVDCSKPCIGQIYSSVTNGESIRICHKCHEIREEKDKVRIRNRLGQWE